MKGLVAASIVVLLLFCLGCGAVNPAQKSALPVSQQAAANVTVNISSPQASSALTNTFSVTASATSTNPISGWEVDIDGSGAYTASAANSITATLTTVAGTHQLLVKAWDDSGTTGSQTVQISVTDLTPPSPPSPPPPPPTPPSSNPLPTPPANAVTFTNVQQSSGVWHSCGDTACSGGTGVGTYWQAFGQSTPSMSGSSMELYRDGIYADALWTHKLGSYSSATNLLWDFYFQVDQDSLINAQSLEFDPFQFVDGYNYMAGSQCNYAAGVWDVWDGVNRHWVHTTIPCNKFSADTWHHIQWYVTTDHTAHTYTYVTLVVDGQPYNVNITESALNNGWSSNIGVQWQLDVNAKGGGYHEWVDQVTFTIW